MQAGLLTRSFSKERVAVLGDDDLHSRAPWFQEPQLTLNLEVIEKLKLIAECKEVRRSHFPSFGWGGFFVVMN